MLNASNGKLIALSASFMFCKRLSTQQDSDRPCLVRDAITPPGCLPVLGAFFCKWRQQNVPRQPFAGYHKDTRNKTLVTKNVWRRLCSCGSRMQVCSMQALALQRSTAHTSFSQTFAVFVQVFAWYARKRNLCPEILAKWARIKTFSLRLNQFFPQRLFCTTASSERLSKGPRKFSV